MKTIQIGFLLCLLTGVVFCQTNTTVLPTRLLPVISTAGISDMSVIVGYPTNRWLYVWPHDLLPETFMGLGVKSTPVDRTASNLGQTKQNWGRPVELTNATAKIAITCRRDYRSPWAEEVQLRTYASVDFHGLPAGLATLASGSTISLTLVFRQNGVVFEMTATDEEPSACQAAIFSAAEQIWRFNKKEASTKVQ